MNVWSGVYCLPAEQALCSFFKVYISFWTYSVCLLYPSMIAPSTSKWLPCGEWIKSEWKPLVELQGEERDSSPLSSSWVLCVSVWGVSVFNGLTISCMKWNWHFYSAGEDSDCLLVINQRRNWLGGTGFFLSGLRPSFLSFSHTFSSCVCISLWCISLPYR